MTRMPTGTVTFLFSDIEGSTRLLETHPDAMAPALARHHELLATAVRANRGVVFETVGDAVYAAFQAAPDAARAAVACQRALITEDWSPIPAIRVRIALTTGVVESRGDHYFGAPLFRCARLQALATGGQTLISDSTASLTRQDLPSGSELEDLGWQRLKDLDEPEHVYQLNAEGLTSKFPPLRTQGESKNNLPAEVSNFVDREESLRDLLERVAMPGVLVIVGPGGVGKTRLATHLARQVLDRFADGVYLVELAPLSQAEECLPALALALHLRESPGRSIAEVVTAFLADKRMLLILDNAEHLGDVRALIRELADAAPKSTIIVTSRTSVDIPGVHHQRIDPLAMSPGDQGDDDPAITLLADRVRSRDPTFRVTTENAAAMAGICRQVDRLPLGLELIAPVVATLGTRDALDSLLGQRAVAADSEAADRHESLWATVAWSYRLLEAGTRAVFDQVAVFDGSFDIDGARAVCDTSDADVDLAVVALSAASLLTPSGDTGQDRRFSLLATVRDFALDQLTEQEAIGARNRLATHIRELASRCFAANWTEDAGFWRSRLLQELPNVRAALHWTADTAPEHALTMARDLAPFWDAAGLGSEGRLWLERALHHRTTDAPSRCQALRWLGILQEHQGDLKAAARTYRTLSTLQRGFGDMSGLADTKRGMAGVAAVRGEGREARRLLTEAIAIHRRDGDRRLIADGLHQLALQELEDGDPNEALSYAAEMEELYAEIGHRTGVAVAIHDRAIALGQLGRLAEAEEAERSAISQFREMGQALWLPFCLLNLAWIQLAAGDSTAAKKQLCESLPLAQQTRTLLVVPDILEGMAAVSAIEGDSAGATRTISAAASLREAGGWPRPNRSSRELRRYIQSKPRAEMPPAEADLVVIELIEACHEQGPN